MSAIPLNLASTEVRSTLRRWKEAVDIDLGCGSDVDFPVRHGRRSKPDGWPGLVARSRLRAVVKLAGDIGRIVGAKNGRASNATFVCLHRPDDAVRRAIS